MSAMTNSEILEQLKSLPVAERLRIVESTADELRGDMERSGAQAGAATEARLVRGDGALLADYSKDREWTALTALDFWRFNELHVPAVKSFYSKATRGVGAESRTRLLREVMST